MQSATLAKHMEEAGAKCEWLFWVNAHTDKDGTKSARHRSAELSNAHLDNQ